MDGYDGFLGGWVDGLEGFAVNAFDEFVVDEAGRITVSTGSLVGVYTEAAMWGQQIKATNRRMQS